MRNEMIGKPLRITFYGLILLALLSTSLVTVFAQGSTPTDDDVNRIAKQLYCPVCESTPLDVCPTEACRQWRDLIRQMLSEGKSEDQIKQYFVDQYGVRVLNEPPNKFVSYIVPAIAFLLGVYLLVRGFQMWLKPVSGDSGTNENNAPDSDQDEYIKKMEEELRKRK